MNEIERQHFLDELRENLKLKDFIKAKVVLSHLGEMDLKIQDEALGEINRDKSEFSLQLLAFILSNVQNISLSEQSLRAALLRKIMQWPDYLISILENPDFKNKKVFIELCGKIQLTAAAPYLLKYIIHASDPEVIRTIITALGAIGDPAAVNTITEYLYSGDRDLVLKSITALKEIANPAAIQRLAERMGTDHELDIFIIDALASIQDAPALEKLNDMLLSHYAYTRNHAKTKLTEIGSKAAPVLIENLHQDDPDLLIHTLNVLGEIGDISAVKPIRKLLQNEPKDSNVRFAAYEALGMIPLQKGAYILTGGLSDPVEQVRIAAAKAVEQNCNEIIIAGIKNMLLDEEHVVQQIVSAFINSESDNIFVSLICSNPFRESAIKYLAEKAHPDIKKHFESLLEQKGFRDLAEQIQAAVKEKPQKEQLMIYVADDSRMILKVYKNALHQLGYLSQLYEFPEGAFEQIKKEKPDILITDLNMPKINGIELTKMVRSLYTGKELPIMMVTTQEDAQDKDAAYAAGVNAVLYKPFSNEQLKAEIEKIIKL